MAYALLHCHCINCGACMACNPVRVPSVRVNGKREPVCKACVERYNAERIKQGLEPFPIPADAYEACHESELPSE